MLVVVLAIGVSGALVVAVARPSADSGAGADARGGRAGGFEPPSEDWARSLAGWAAALVVDAESHEAVVQSANRTVTALATGDGSVRWTADVPGIWSQPPAVSTAGVLVSAGDRVVALDRTTGERRWAAPVTGRAGPVAWVRSGDETLALVGSWAGELTALDSDDGSRRWTIEQPGAIRAVPATAPGTVVAAWHGADRSTLAAVDPRDGTLRWEQPLGEAASAPILIGDVVVVGGGGGAIRAFSLDGGVEVWAASGAGPFTPDLGAAPAGSDVVVVDAEGRLHVLDAATGADHRILELDVPVVRGSPQVGGRSIVVTAADGTVVVAPRAESGPVARWRLGGFPAAAQLVGERLLVALRLTDPGRVLAYRLP